MQRLLACLLALILVLTLGVACGGDDDDGDDSAAPTATVPAATGDEATATIASDTGEGDATNGEALVASNGCTACHSIDGTIGAGPSWKGLYGHDVTLDDGSTVTADDAYITESIHDPGAKIVEGFQNVMPATFGDMSDADVNDIIACIKTLH